MLSFNFLNTLKVFLISLYVWNHLFEWQNYVRFLRRQGGRLTIGEGVNLYFSANTGIYVQGIGGYQHYSFCHAKHSVLRYVILEYKYECEAKGSLELIQPDINP